MNPDSVEEELFGREEGGHVVRTGLFEQAHGGTLFLDEVADMPLTTQAKILRVLTEQVFQRIGGSRNVRVDVRVVSATARDLAAEIAEGRFREDLYYRLNVVPVRLPPLRDRREDVLALIDHYLDHYAERYKRPRPALAPEALGALVAHDWPGNVRALRHAVERAVILAGDGPLGADAFPLASPFPSIPKAYVAGDGTRTVVGDSRSRRSHRGARCARPSMLAMPRDATEPPKSRETAALRGL